MSRLIRGKKLILILIFSKITPLLIPPPPFSFLAVVECVRNRPAFFAKLLHNTTKGLGTRDADLIRLVVSRAECDLGDIKVQK